MTLVVDVKAVKMMRTKKAVGIDFGISRLATLSNGEMIANPMYLIERVSASLFFSENMLVPRR